MDGLKNDHKTLTEEEKLQLRKQRFNSGANLNTLESAKLLEEEKRKIMERQKKFGVIVEIPEIEQEKIRKRKERFGILGKSDEEDILKKRAERFNITSESDILRKRAERFKNELDHPEGTKVNTRKIKRWKRNGENNGRVQRDRRGPKRFLGFKKFGRRNRLRKRRFLKNRRNND